MNTNFEHADNNLQRNKVLVECSDLPLLKPKQIKGWFSIVIILNYGIFSVLRDCNKSIIIKFKDDATKSKFINKYLISDSNILKFKDGTYTYDLWNSYDFNRKLTLESILSAYYHRWDKVTSCKHFNIGTASILTNSASVYIFNSKKEREMCDKVLIVDGQPVKCEMGMYA